MQVGVPNRVRFGAFEFDLRAGELRRGARRVLLQEQPYQILLMLVEERGEIVTLTEIKKRLWPNDTAVEFDQGIQSAIKKLRRAFGDSASNPKYIETVARRGYRLIPPMEVEGDSSSDPAPPLASAAYDKPVPCDLSGTKVTHYRVLEIIGGGGMGVVYKAEDLKLGRLVALKFLPEEVALDLVTQQRFEREARAVSALSHPNICPIYEFDEQESQSFIVMELLQGKTLREHLAGGALQLNDSSRLDIAIQIAAGLEAAHERGIIHRDIKPANIFITEKSVAKILDFGVAKVLEGSEPPASAAAAPGEALAKPVLTNLTRTGMKPGTAGYMSPEQVRGEIVDVRTDIFSFGLVLYEMETGERAFTGNTIVTINDAILHRLPRPVREANPKASVGLETIVAKCLEKDRERRYQSTGEVKTDLQRLARHSERSRWLWAIAAALFLVSILGIWIASRRPKLAPEPKLTQLTSNFNENPIRTGAISPDNKYLAYADLQGVHLRDLKTGETRNLTSPPGHGGARFNDVSWLPDGSALIANYGTPAERDTPGSHLQIWLIPLSGVLPHLLREDAEASAVSEDGKAILFNTNRGAFGTREVWQMDSTGGHEQLLLKTDKDSAALGSFWLGNDRIAYLTSDKLGVTVDSRKVSGGPSTTALTFHDQAHTSRLMSFFMLQNGRTFYVQAEPASNSLYCTLWEARIDPETGKLAQEPRKLTSRTRSCITLMPASADGRRILFMEWAAEESIYVADLASNGTKVVNSRRVTPNEVYLVTAWTADSKEVVYRASHNGQTGIFRQSIFEGSAEPIVASMLTHQLGAGRGLENLNNTKPRLTPDGKFVLYTLYDETQSDAARQKILRVPVEGGQSEFVLSANLYGVPDCARALHGLCVFSERSEDRKQIVFTSFGPFGGRGREVATFSANPQADYRWVISPESDRIALANNQEPTIDLLYLNGRPPQTITVKGQRNFDWIFWAPNGEGFYASTQGENRSLLLHVDLHGNARHVWEEAGGLGTYGIPSPDGHHIAMHSWTLATNLWTMENF